MPIPFKQPSVPEPQLLAVAYRFAMPQGEPFAVKLNVESVGMSSSLTLARDAAMAEAQRRQISADYPRPDAQFVGHDNETTTHRGA